VICAVLLAVYAVGIGCLAPGLLRRGWSVRAPSLAIIVWLMLSASCVAAAVLAALAVAVPMPVSWNTTLAGGSVLSSPVAVTGLLALVILTRIGGCLAGDLARGRRERREHAAFLAAAGREDHELGAVILDQDAPAAYCLPGGRRRVVVSAGALAALQPQQLQAVLAHERAHLRGHHHAILTWAFALGRALPMVPLLTQAGPALAELAEMAADDAAIRRHAPGDLAAALVIVARAGARVTMLAVGGTAAITRIQRLLAPQPRPSRPARTAGLAGAAVALLLPALFASLTLLVTACGVASHP
jgi:Zn-dependent protease with chaperone function